MGLTSNAVIVGDVIKSVKGQTKHLGNRATMQDVKHQKQKEEGREQDPFVDSLEGNRTTNGTF